MAKKHVFYISITTSQVKWETCVPSIRQLKGHLKRFKLVTYFFYVTYILYQRKYLQQAYFHVPPILAGHFCGRF